jgi:manganese transport protein
MNFNLKSAWRKDKTSHSLSEVYSSIKVPKKASFWRKYLAFAGPGLMIAVGYMDPGNWATDIAGGAQFGYTLLSVILISNIFAMVLQHLSVKLGVVAERDLAQACRDHFSPTTNFILWVFCEIAIAACDLAEVIGSAIALNLLFHIPLTWGIVITTVDVLVILLLQAKGFRWIESIVGGLIFIILACFVYEIVISKPAFNEILGGLVPQKEIIQNPAMLYIAIGILGATVMPHNLYLHSSIVQTRDYTRDTEGKKRLLSLRL